MKFSEGKNRVQNMIDILSELVQVILANTIQKWKIAKLTTNFIIYSNQLNHQYPVKAYDIKILWNSLRMT